VIDARHLSPVESGGERLTYNRLVGSKSLQIQKRDRSILTVVLLSMSGAQPVIRQPTAYPRHARNLDLERVGDAMRRAMRQSEKVQA